MDRTSRAPATGAWTAERFAARLRARRRARWVALGVIVTLLLASAYLVFWSPLLRVQQVTIAGLSRVAPASVHRITDGAIGRPLADADVDDLARRLVTVPLVRTAQVIRQWPATLRIVIEERRAAAAVTAPGGGYRLLDQDGVQVAAVPAAPPQLPLLDGDVAKAGPAALHAALTVLAALPADLRAGMTGIGATSPDGVWFTLDGRGRVTWGSSDDEAAKITALRTLLLATPGANRNTTFDVSAPLAPAVKAA